MAGYLVAATAVDHHQRRNPGDPGRRGQIWAAPAYQPCRTPRRSRGRRRPRPCPSAHHPLPYAVTCTPARSGKIFRPNGPGTTPGPGPDPAARPGRPAACSAPGEPVGAGLAEGVRDGLPRQQPADGDRHHGSAARDQVHRHVAYVVQGPELTGHRAHAVPAGHPGDPVRHRCHQAASRYLRPDSFPTPARYLSGRTTPMTRTFVSTASRDRSRSGRAGPRANGPPGSGRAGAAAPASAGARGLLAAPAAARAAPRARSARNQQRGLALPAGLTRSRRSDGRGCGGPVIGMAGDAGVVEDQQPTGVIPGSQPGDVCGQFGGRHRG